MLPLPENPIDPPPSGSGGGSPATGVIGTPIFNLTFDKDESGSTLKCMAYCNFASPDDIQAQAYLWIDGVLGQQCSINMPFSGSSSNAKVPATIPMFVSGISAGPHNIQLTIRNFEASHETLTILAGAFIEISELKAASL